MADPVPGASLSSPEDTSRVPQTGEPLLASASIDGEVKFWRLGQSGKHKSNRVHNGAVWALANLGDGRVASGGKDTCLRMWDLVNNGDLCQEIRPGNAGPINSLQPLWGGRLAVGHSSGVIRLFNIGDGASASVRFGQVAALVAEATGQRVDDGGLVATLTAHSATVNTLCTVEVPPAAGRPLRRLLASGGDDKIICLWDIAGGVGHATLDCGALVYALADLGGGFLCAGLQDGQIQVWDLTTNAIAAAVPQAHDGLWVKALCRRPGAAVVVSGGGDCCVRQWKWDAERRALEPIGEPYRGHTKAVTTVYADPEGWVLSGGGTAVHVWGAKGIRDGTVIRGHDAMVTSITRVVQEQGDEFESPAGSPNVKRSSDSGEASVMRRRRDGARIPEFSFSG